MRARQLVKMADGWGGRGVHMMPISDWTKLKMSLGSRKKEIQWGSWKVVLKLTMEELMVRAWSPGCPRQGTWPWDQVTVVLHITSQYKSLCLESRHAHSSWERSHGHIREGHQTLASLMEQKDITSRQKEGSRAPTLCRGGHSEQIKGLGPGSGPGKSPLRLTLAPPAARKTIDTLGYSNHAILPGNS